MQPPREDDTTFMFPSTEPARSDADGLEAEAGRPNPADHPTSLHHAPSPTPTVEQATDPTNNIRPDGDGIPQNPPWDSDTAQSVRNALAKVLRSSKKLDLARQKALLLRDELRYEQEVATYKRNYFQQCRQRFMNLLVTPSERATDREPTRSPPGAHRNSFEAEVGQLTALHHLLTEDHEALEAQDAKLQPLQDELSRTEFSMQGKEQSLEQATAHLLSLVQSLGFASAEELESGQMDSYVTTQHSPSTQPTTPELAPALTEYYDKAGDVGVMRDRLIELEVEHRDALTARILRIDQDLHVEPSDHDFETSFQLQHAAATKAYDDALAAHSIARRTCLEQGIDPGLDVSKADLRTTDAFMLDNGIPLVGDEQWITTHFDPFTQSPAVAINHPTLGVDQHFMSRRNASSTMLTALTGNMNTDSSGLTLRRSQHDAEQSKQRIQAWIQSSNLDEAPALSEAEDESHVAESWEHTTSPITSNRQSAPNLSSWHKVSGHIPDDEGSHRLEGAPSYETHVHEAEPPRQLRPRPKSFSGMAIPVAEDEFG